MPTPDTLPGLLALGRDIWGDRRMSLAEVSVAASVVTGDLARIARDRRDTEGPLLSGLERELGNLILSSTRWADDLGLNVADCVAAAEQAQRAYAARLEGRDVDA